ncbi:MAG: hypothetical protein ACM3RX_01390 [Methanococcaceae archaeon]
MNKEQYSIIAGKRQTYDQLLWQTPVLSLTAQAFLLTIILGAGSSDNARILAALLSFITSIASIILMYKHRYFETESSKCLEKFEKENQDEGYEPCHDHKPHSDEKVPTLVRISSFTVWILTLSSFGLVSLIVLIFPCFIE